MNNEMINILKRIFIGVCIGIILMFIRSCNVKAIANTGVFNDLIIPASEQEGRFYTNNSGTLSNTGYSFLISNDIYYALPSTPNYYYGNYGGVLSICNLSFLTNNYYSITYTFVSSGGDYVHPNFSASTYKLGMMQNIVDTNLSFNFESVNSGWQYAYIPGLLPVGDEIYTYTIIFKAVGAYTCLSSAFSSNSKNLSATELAFVGYKYESLGSQPLTEQQMTTIINNSNQQVINNIQNSANSIINNQNSNTIDIINNQNANIEKQIESQQVCKTKTLTHNDVVITDKYLSSEGSLIIATPNTWGITDYIEIKGLKIIAKADYSFIYSCFYDENKTLISCIASNTNPGTVTLPNNTKYARFSIRINDIPEYQIEYCNNGNQAINDTMTDDTPPNNSDFNDAINSVSNALPSNSTIASLVTMPITFLQKIIDGLGGTCSEITIGNIYGYTMTMPCINPSDYIGIIWNIIDVICAGFFAFIFGKRLVVIFHNITSMHEGGLKEAYD